MVNVLGLLLVTTVPMIIAVIGGYFLWVKLRPKKMSWVAFIYKQSDAKFRTGQNDKNVGGLTLNNLDFYGRDVVVRDEASRGRILFRLVSLNKTVPEPTPECVRYIPKVGRVVDVLLKGETCTLLRAGYDASAGVKVWNPLPYDTYTALKNDMSIQLERIQSRKDLLAQLAPYVVMILGFMVVMGLGYMGSSGMIKIAEENGKATEMQSDAFVKAAQLYRDAEYARLGKVPEPTPKLGAQPQPEPIKALNEE